MTQQYLRKVHLSIGSKNTTYDLSELHIQFQVKGGMLDTLKHATITIWNLSFGKVAAIAEEFTDVTLSAGYKEGPFGEIFAGQIARVEAGKENAVDSYVRIFAQDGDEAKNWSVTSATLAAGWTDNDMYNRLMADFKAHGLQAGYYDSGDKVSMKAPRATTMHGRTADYFNELANHRGCDWWIEDGKVNLLPRGTALPGSQQVLTSNSGLIGVPKLTLGGVEVRCLLNPNIKQGVGVKIDNSLVNQLVQKHPFLNDVKSIVPGIPGNGIYAAHYVIHSGDTRGQEWYTDTICAAFDQSGEKGDQPLFFDVPDAV